MDLLIFKVFVTNVFFICSFILIDVAFINSRKESAVYKVILLWSKLTAASLIGFGVYFIWCVL